MHGDVKVSILQIYWHCPLHPHPPLEWQRGQWLCLHLEVCNDKIAVSFYKSMTSLRSHDFFGERISLSPETLRPLCRYRFDDSFCQQLIHCLLKLLWAVPCPNVTDSWVRRGAELHTSPTPSLTFGPLIWLLWLLHPLASLSCWGWGCWLSFQNDWQDIGFFFLDYLEVKTVLLVCLEEEILGALFFFGGGGGVGGVVVVGWWWWWWWGGWGWQWGGGWGALEIDWKSTMFE